MIDTSSSKQKPTHVSGLLFAVNGRKIEGWNWLRLMCKLSCLNFITIKLINIKPLAENNFLGTTCAKYNGKEFLLDFALSPAQYWLLIHKYKLPH